MNAALIRIAVCLAFTSPFALAADSAGDTAALASAGLTRVGNFYLLDIDTHLAERLKEIAIGERQLQSFKAQSRTILTDISKSEDTVDALHRDYDTQAAVRDRTPDADARNRVIDAMNIDLEHIDEGTRYLQKRKADLAALTAPIDLINKTMQLTDDLEIAAARYEELAKNPQIAHAIDSAGASGVKVHLGPSPTFKQQLPRLKIQRDKFKTAAIKLSAEGGVPTVTVSLNGMTTTPMTVDSGATFVSLTWSVAVKAGIKPTGSEPQARLKIANGGEINARVVTVPEMQVGQFSVKNVQCVVLPQGMDESAGCLLGDSFMKNFLYQMDLTAGVLNLTPVSAAASARPPASPVPTTAPMPTHVNSDGSITLMITAAIDGGETIRMTANGLIWTHNFASWPTDVKVNDVRWDPQSWPTIASTADFEALRQVDFSTAKIISMKGRGTIELKTDSQSATLAIADADEGIDQYAVAITIYPHGAAPPPASQPAASTEPTTLPNEFAITIRAKIDSREEFLIGADGIAFKHVSGKVPTGVTVNDAAWDVQSSAVFYATSSLQSLRNVDLTKPRVIRQAGRGTFTVTRVDDGVHVAISDGHPGAADYEISIGFPLKD